ncbi:TPA: hypothetical protein I7259_24590 [Vibrio parahaemolyticus]|nr:hypothetical protein [Vibrio parahaemolyticus]
MKKFFNWLLITLNTILIITAIYKLIYWLVESESVTTKITLAFMIPPLLSAFSVTPRAINFANNKIEDAYILLLSKYDFSLVSKPTNESKLTDKIWYYFKIPYAALSSFFTAIEVKMINALFNNSKKKKNKTIFLTKIEPVQLAALKVLNDIATILGVIILLFFQVELGSYIAENGIYAFYLNHLIEGQLELLIFFFIYLSSIGLMQYFMTRKLIQQEVS